MTQWPWQWSLPGRSSSRSASLDSLSPEQSGATVAAVGTFLPCYLLTVIPAPYFKKHGKRPGIVAFVDGVTAAAIGAIAGAVVVLARRTVFDGWTPDVFKVVLFLVTVALLWRFKRLPEPVLVAGAAAVGWIAYPWMH